jgi:ABC-type amino acid transport substrate-binding protein
MKQNILTIVIAAVVAFSVVWGVGSRGGADSAGAPARESAYDRVMRTGVLRCGYYVWPPYFEQDSNTKDITGLIPDLMDQIGAYLDLKIEYVQLSAMGMQIEDMKRGMYDTTCMDSYVVFTMIKMVDYSAPYAYVPVFAYVRSDDQRWTRMEDLNNPDINFVGLDGDLSVGLVGHRFPKAKLTTLAATVDAATLMVNVATKKADAAIIDSGLVNSYNRNNDVKLRPLESAPAVYPIVFSVTKGEDRLVRMLDGGVSALINTGVMDELIEKYKSEGIVLYPVQKDYFVPKE